MSLPLNCTWIYFWVLSISIAVFLFELWHKRISLLYSLAEVEKLSVKMKFADSAKILFDTEFLHCKTLVDPSVSRITRLRDKFSRLDFECKCDQKLGATKFASTHEKFSSTFLKISIWPNFFNSKKWSIEFYASNSKFEVMEIIEVCRDPGDWKNCKGYNCFLDRQIWIRKGKCLERASKQLQLIF